MYADDTQVYISTPATDHVDAMDRLAACIERIRDWMADNYLKLNEETDHLAGYTPAAEQSNGKSFDPSQCYC